MQPIKSNVENNNRKLSARRTFWAIIRCVPDSRYREVVVEAHDEEAALTEAMAIVNRETFGPDEQNGFDPVAALDREEMLTALRHARKRVIAGKTTQLLLWWLEQ